MNKLLLLLPLFLLATGVLLPAVSFAETDEDKDYLTIREQVKQGTPVENLQCYTFWHILAMRDNGNPACVAEWTAERMNWEIIKTEFENDLDKLSLGDLSSDRTKNVTYGERYEHPQDEDGNYVFNSEPFGYNIHHRSITLSDLPKLGETTQIKYEITAVDDSRIFDYPDHNAVIHLPEGFELVDGTINKTATWKANEPFVVDATIKAVQPGNWTIYGDSQFAITGSVNIVVSEDESYFHKGHFKTPPREPVPSTCVSASTSVTQDKFDEIIQQIPISDESSNPTSGDAGIVMSSDTIKLGQTANYTLTVKSLGWPPYPPINSLTVLACNDGNGMISDISVPKTLHYDHLLDDDKHYFTVTGQIKPPTAGEWRFYTDVLMPNVKNDPSSAYVTVTEE